MARLKMKRHSRLARLKYRPVTRHALDLEILSVSMLRQRYGRRLMRLPHRYAFNMLLCITSGACTQYIDFESVQCTRGSLILLQAGQAHRFGVEREWQGWIVLFRPEFSPIERLPAHLSLRSRELEPVKRAIEQMQEDSKIAAGAADVNRLLRHQLQAFLLRLSLLHESGNVLQGAASRSTQRSSALQQLLDREYARWHQVAQYASALGCSGKTLTRASLKSTGLTAKAVIAARINLEAKRLLTHSSFTIDQICGQLGFEDAANFSKFFKKEAGCSPGEFRRRQTTDLRRPV